MTESKPVRHIYRWDLDKTYLRTEFDTVKDLIRTALQKPEEKVNVPGAVALLRELTRDDTTGRAMVTFVSGSPRQMRESLEKKFELDGIKPDVFILKPTLENILRGRFRAIRGQVGYKLDTLLELRLDAPRAPETLFGDDAEQDAFIYSLYSDVTAGRLGPEALHEILVEAEVYEDSADSIMRHVEQLETYDNVGRIFINLDRRTPPGRFWVFGPRIVPIINYFQAALILYADGTLEADAVMNVAAGMYEEHDYGLVELTNSFQDLLRRRHLELETVERFESELDFDRLDGDERGRRLPAGFLTQLLRRARSLAPRRAGPPREWEGPPDYIDILRADRKMRESVQEKGGLFS